MNPSEHVATLPFTRMLAGPMGYTPGIVDLDGFSPQHRVPHTLAKEPSLYVVLYSPVQMAADLPESYAIARKQRGSPDWFLGALTDENARSLRLPLNFLAPKSHYVAEIYRDGPQADRKTRPYDLVIEQRTVTAADTLDLALASSGGAAIRFRQVR